MAIRGKLTTTMWGETLVAETTEDIGALRPIGAEDSASENWNEITEEEWLSNFSS